MHTGVQKGERTLGSGDQPARRLLVALGSTLTPRPTTSASTAATSFPRFTRSRRCIPAATLLLLSSSSPSVLLLLLLISSPTTAHVGARRTLRTTPSMRSRCRSLTRFLPLHQVHNVALSQWNSPFSTFLRSQTRLNRPSSRIYSFKLDKCTRFAPDHVQFSNRAKSSTKHSAQQIFRYVFGDPFDETDRVVNAQHGVDERWKRRSRLLAFALTTR